MTKGGFKMYCAHIRDDGAVQTVMEHLTGTAKLLSKFFEPLNCNLQQMKAPTSLGIMTWAGSL